MGIAIVIRDDHRDQACCPTCGWAGPPRKDATKATNDALEHNRDCHWFDGSGDA